MELILALFFIFLLCVVSVLRYFKKNVVTVRVNERIVDAVKETIEEKRVRIHKEIEKSQWKKISRRLDYLGEAGIEETSLCNPSALNSESSCIGAISLMVHDDGYGKNQKSIPMPLFKENRSKLEEMGFVISKDHEWAIYRENQESSII